MREFTRERLADYPAWLSNAGHATNTIGRKLASASGFGHWLAARGELPTNPLDYITRPKRRKSLPRAIPTEQADKLLQTGPISSEGDSPRDRCILALMRYAGLRIGEVHNLDVEDITPEVVLVRQGKGGKDRAIPVVPVLRDVLAAWLTQHGGNPGPLFPGTVTPRLSTRGIHKLVARARRRAGLAKLTPHQLRHTFGTEAIRAGVPTPYVQAMMGHASLETTARYVQVTASDLQKAMGQAGEWWTKKAAVE